MIVIGWNSCLLWTAHTPCGVNSLRKSNQIKSNQVCQVSLPSLSVLLLSPS
jgi:hypothetical protein